jgi:hypothetical protein
MKRRVEKVFAALDPKPDAVLLANATDPHLDQSFFHLFEVPGGLFEGSVADCPPGRIPRRHELSAGGRDGPSGRKA